MPLYDFECEGCGHVFEDVKPMSFTGRTGCPCCREPRAVKVILQAPRARVPDSGWESENGGRGRLIPQLAARPDVDDPNAYCRSRTEAIEKAKRQGWQNITKV